MASSGVNPGALDMVADIMMSFPLPPHEWDALLPADQDLRSKEHCLRLKRMLVETRAAETQWDRLLKMIDPTTHAASYIIILSTALEESLRLRSNKDFLTHLLRFCLRFDGVGVRCAGKAFGHVLQLIGAGEIFPPQIAVEALSSIILGLDPTGSMLTSTHIDLVRIAYETQHVGDCVRDVITKPILFFPNMKYQRPGSCLLDPTLQPPEYISTSSRLTRDLTYQQVLQYDYLCGLIFCQWRDWPRALSAFERVMTHPCADSHPSRIMVEGYKKWALVSLLTSGSLPRRLPPVTSASAARAYSRCRHYRNLADLFARESSEESGGEAAPVASLPGATAAAATAAAATAATAAAVGDGPEAGTRPAALDPAAAAKAVWDGAMGMDEVWAADGNQGLVREVLASYQKWTIINVLATAYEKLSLADVRRLAPLIGPRGLESEPGEGQIVDALLSMIEEGHLPGARVVLEPPPPKADSGKAPVAAAGAGGAFEPYLDFNTLVEHIDEDAVAGALETARGQVEALRAPLRVTKERLMRTPNYVRALATARTNKGQGGVADMFDASVEDEDLMNSSFMDYEV